MATSLAADAEAAPGPPEDIHARAFPSWQKKPSGGGTGTDAASSSSCNNPQERMPEEIGLLQARREGYLHKRAGWFRWTVRYFRLLRGELCWWRPSFTEQLRLQRPKNLDPAAIVRCFTLAEDLLEVKLLPPRFPFTTRLVLRFRCGYKLELRAEREPAIRDWYDKIKLYVQVPTEEDVVDQLAT
ncbi:unnamed protein product [Amoebophrya sp. A120]|nr:unnamed protein product [Amoebophrya sp. A120]|eukprot:GSA120T00021574001.1